MKIKTTIYIHYSQYDWEETGAYQVMYAKLDDSDQRTFVCQQEIEIEVPDDYDPRAQKIEALEKKKRQVMAEYQRTVDEINERISKLQAIAYSA